jgi:hypothetical protein
MKQMSQVQQWIEEARQADLRRVASGTQEEFLGAQCAPKPRPWQQERLERMNAGRRRRVRREGSPWVFTTNTGKAERRT